MWTLGGSYGGMFSPWHNGVPPSSFGTRHVIFNALFSTGLEQRNSVLLWMSWSNSWKNVGPNHLYVLISFMWVFSHPECGGWPFPNLTGSVRECECCASYWGLRGEQPGLVPTLMGLPFSGGATQNMENNTPKGVLQKRSHRELRANALGTTWANQRKLPWRSNFWALPLVTRTVYEINIPEKFPPYFFLIETRWINIHVLKCQIQLFYFWKD